MAEYDGETAKTWMIDIHSPIEWGLLLTGRKSVVRNPKRAHHPAIKTPTVVMLRNETECVPFLLLSIERGELHQVDLDEAVLEGFTDLESFKRFWITKTQKVYFSPTERVWRYHLVGPWSPSMMWDFDHDGPEWEAVMKVVTSLYPIDVQ